LASWDVFHGDRLELERGLSTDAIRQGLVRGELRDDDLVRPAGTTVAWARLTEIAELLEPAETVSAPQSPAPPPPSPSVSGTDRPVHPDRDPAQFEVETEGIGQRPSADLARTIRSRDRLELPNDSGDVSFPVISDQVAEPRILAPSPPPAETPAAPAWAWAVDDDEDDDLDNLVEVGDDIGANDLEILEDDLEPGPPADLYREAGPASNSSHVALPVVTARGWDDTGGESEADEDEDFTFSRSGPMTVEELDLAPMVDVAFQLVLFFMVTATTVLYKTLEIPKPTAEKAPSAVAQGRSKTLDDYKDDYIIVEIDPSGAMKIDREPVPSEMNALVERLRSAREKTGRKALLLSADYNTKHRNSVLVLDAANEIGLAQVIARPSRPQGPGPNPFAGSPPATPPPRAGNSQAPPTN
jgi:biopolymer transport protein ExbD